MTTTKTKPPAVKKPRPKKPEPLSVAVRINDKVYRLFPEDLGPADDVALRRALGVSVMGLMDQVETSPGLDSIAAVAWLCRRQEGETTLTYEQACEGITYGSDLDVMPGNEDEEAEGEA